MHFVVQRQRVVSLAPRIANPFVPVDDKRIHIKPPEARGDPQPGLPARGVFLLSLQVDVVPVLSRLAGMGLGGEPRTMMVPGGGVAATVTDPDGVMVELLPKGELSLMKK